MNFTANILYSIKKKLLLTKGKPGNKMYGALQNYVCINTASLYIIKINKLQTGNGRR